MDAKRAYNDHRWTNERHLHFLKSLEASFVRTMLEKRDNRVFLPMDRYLPDSCESTLDSKTTTTTKRRKRHFPTDYLDEVKRLRLHPSAMLQDDQVVPQIKHIKTEDDDNKWTNSP
ncbi:uncharacterized protein LOC111901766 [Lactuca sativa]|uniref:uncharacterized protein LOC111901766 n=1 Tax=Lactuca sativa TaxID=4236 RepID=UPI000CC6D04B|nr:uncharacterized protein LOC111901766 [Lactuca sativa]